MKQVIVGLDEAGRGSLFGSIVACAVVQDESIVSWNNKDIIIRDSKKMTALQRQRTCRFLEKHCMYGIGICDASEIDTKGIGRCNKIAMHRAIDDLCRKYPDIEILHLLVDGNQFEPYRTIPYTLIVHGDDSTPVISCASIIAKTTRDESVLQLCQEQDLEKYGIANNKGYGTKKHIGAIQTFGAHSMHRQTFLTKILNRVGSHSEE